MTENQSLSADYSAFVRKLFNRAGDPSKDFAHAILGAVTEAYELATATDDVNALEELGDQTFYREAAYQVLSDFSGAPLERGEDYEVALNNAIIAAQQRIHTEGITRVVVGMANDLLDISKRWIGYGKAPEPLATLAKVDLYIHVSSSFWAASFTPERIIHDNMAKLLKRYPGGEFDAFRAVVRDLEAERGVLQAA